MFSSIKIKVALCCPMFRKSKLMVSHGAQLVVRYCTKNNEKVLFYFSQKNVLHEFLVTSGHSMCRLV